MDEIATTNDLRRDAQALVESWLDAARSGDIDRIMSHYTADVVAYDAILALRFEGTDAYREHWKACMEMCPGEMAFEPGEMHVEGGGDAGFVHFLARCGVVDESGAGQMGWMRVTMGLRRTDAGWKIAHEHSSMPFEPESGQVLGDVGP